MGLQRDIEDHSFSELNYDDEVNEIEEGENTAHKREVRRMLEDRLERKRLRKELEDEFDDEFDWNDFDR